MQNFIDKVNKKRNSEEDRLHKSIAAYLNLALTNSGVDWETIEVSTGGNQIRAKHLKAKGVKAGTPDILITYNPDIRQPYHFILRLEVKSKTGYLTESQKERIPELKTKGQFVEVVRSVEDVERALRKYKFPISARVM